MPKKPSLPMEQREKITFSIKKVYSEKLVPLLIMYEDTGDKSEQICKALVKLDELLKIKEIAVLVEEYESFSNLYDNGFMDSSLNKNDAFTKYLSSRNINNSFSNSNNFSSGYCDIQKSANTLSAVTTVYANDGLKEDLYKNNLYSEDSFANECDLNDEDCDNAFFDSFDEDD